MSSIDENPAKIKIIEQDNYEVAYREAAEQLSKMDLAERCKMSGVDLIGDSSDQKVCVNFLNDKIIVSHPNIKLTYEEKTDEPAIWLQILVLHYLLYSNGTQKKGEQITFKQLEGGLGYFTAFHKRTIIPILETFGENFEEFVKTGELVGGSRSNHGDYSLMFNVFPRVGITFIIWKGDEEFPPEGNVVFDSNISDYLTSEDVAVMCNMVAVTIIKKYFLLKK